MVLLKRPLLSCTKALAKFTRQAYSHSYTTQWPTYTVDQWEASKLRSGGFRSVLWVFCGPAGRGFFLRGGSCLDKGEWRTVEELRLVNSHTNEMFTMVKTWRGAKPPVRYKQTANKVSAGPTKADEMSARWLCLHWDQLGLRSENY